MNIIKKIIPDVLMLVIFAAISFAYFYPADIEGRILFRHDSSAGRGMGEETSEYYQKTGEQSRWTGSVFCGMPTYQSAPSYESAKTMNKVMTAYHLWLPENVWLVFVYLLGFYIMLRAFDFKWYLASLGAVIWAFSSYFFIIIAAGHIWKVMALAYLPPMIAGILLAYRGKYLAGLAVTGIFSAFEVNANHVQMTYYYLFIILFMVIGFLIDAIRQKKFMHFVKATAVCAIGGFLGVMTCIPNLYHTWQYQKESMRGKSELVKKNVANQTSSGLDRDYITQWSYGIDETWTLLIPNTKGGSSMSPVSDNPQAREKGDPMFMEVYQQMGSYWGDQPGTSGPVYIGAFVVMLFVLGLFIVKGSLKWSLLAATILSIGLSWGHNMMWLTNLFLDYVPMYAKFRTVASILVIAEFTMPFLAMLALKRLCDDPDCVKGKVFGKKINWLYVSFIITGGICALFAIEPTMFFDSFVSESELNALSQFPKEQLAPLLADLEKVRIAIFTADCWRSFIVIVIGMVTLMIYRMKKIGAVTMTFIITVLCLVDMWQVNKRYLNDGMFVSNTLRTAVQEPTETDLQILKDKSPNYRVLNLASNTFNENETSYYHKSIGGYHAAKLRRYQELLDAYVVPEIQTGFNAIAQAGGDMTKVDADKVMPVIDMLNAKYFILPLQGGKTMPLLNPYAMGNGWYVNDIKYVNNANEELDALGKMNLHTTAVADKQFENILGKSTSASASTSTSASTSKVTCTSYAPNELHYDISSKTGGIVVFSEIYYPGWTCTVDGQPTEIGRVNYVLRAINVKAGAHKVVMTFRPQSINTTDNIAYASMAIMLIMIITSITLQFRRKKN